MENFLFPDCVVCKICERRVSAKWLFVHSTKCKDAAELKEKVLKQQSKLAAIVEKAYDIRNQLNTNFAIQKLKQTRRNSHDYEDTLAMQRNSSSPAYTPDARASGFGFFSNAKAVKDMNKSTIGTKENHKKKNKFERRSSENKGHEYEEEFIRAVSVLQSIIQYGHSHRINTMEVECDIAIDYKIKNEVNFLYVAIKDKRISEYLQEFLETLQKYIKDKQKYLRKLEDSERKEFHSSSVRDSEDSMSSEQTEMIHVPLPNLKGFRMVSLDDSDISDLSSDRRKSKRVQLPDSRWLRRGSCGNPLPPKGHAQQTPHHHHEKRGMTTLSKFASHSPLLRKESRLSQGSQESQDSPINAILPKNEDVVGVFSEKRGKIPQKLLDDLKNMETYQLTKRHSRLFRSCRNLLEVKPLDETPKRRLKRTLTITAKSHQKGAGEDTKTLAHIHDDPKEENKVIKDANKIKELRKQRQSWAHTIKDTDMKILLNKPEILEECQEEEPTSLEDSTDTPKRRQKDEPADEILLSKGDLTPTESSVNSSDESDGNESDKSDSSDDDDDEFPRVTMKGYYSDSEVTDMRTTEPVKKCEIGIDDFQFLKLVGEGAYGKVYLVKKKATGDIYAMKIVNFEDRESTHNRMASLHAESDVYKSIKGDWVVKAYYTFSYETYVCFVLEFMVGGDLQGLLEQIGCFDESIAKIYFAELVLALESLHSLGIVHRDLKPDNVLIDPNGHLKLTDFGLSEKGVVRLKQRAKTIRNASLTNDSIPEILDNIKKDILTQLNIDVDATFGRSVSGEKSIIDLDPMPSPTTLKKIASTITELSGYNEEGGMMLKNKGDEEVVFSFLNSEERKDNWALKKKIGTLEQNAPTPTPTNAASRKKEVNRIIGTPDYMAPEIIKGTDCSDKGVDIWSLGVILYELLVGVPPFNDDSMEKIFDNIVNLRMEWPNIGYEDDCMSPEAADLIKKMLNPDQKQRISLPQVKNHPFFRGFEWNKVRIGPGPVIPGKKDFEAQTPMGVQNIFWDKLNTDAKKDMRRKTVFNEDIDDFQMKRVDLLHQLNQTLYNTHMLSQGAKNDKVA